MGGWRNLGRKVIGTTAEKKILRKLRNDFVLFILGPTLDGAQGSLLVLFAQIIPGSGQRHKLMPAIELGSAIARASTLPIIIYLTSMFKRHCSNPFFPFLNKAQFTCNPLLARYLILFRVHKIAANLINVLFP